MGMPHELDYRKMHENSSRKLDSKHSYQYKKASSTCVEESGLPQTAMECKNKEFSLADSRD